MRWWLVATSARPIVAGAVGSDVRGDRVTLAVDDREVVGRLHRQPREHRDGVLGRRAQLEQVADDERHREAGAGGAPPAERERHAQPGVVDPVEQPPQAVAHAEHRAAGQLGPADHALQQLRIEVVVAHEQRLVAGEDRLRAAGHQRRRVPQREHPRGHVSPAGELARAAPTSGTSSGMCSSSAWRHARYDGPRGVTVAQVPAPIGRPGRLEALLEAGAGLRLRDRVELEHGEEAS